MFHLYNLPRKTEWQCTFNRRMIYGAVKANTNFPYGKMYKWTAKIALTFEQSDGGTNHKLHLYNSLKGSVINKWTMHGAVGANTNSTHTKCMGRTANIAKVILTFECDDGKTMYTFHGIIYSEKHNGTVLLMHEACTKQLPSSPSNFGLNNYSNPKHSWGLLTLQQIF